MYQQYKKTYVLVSFAKKEKEHLRLERTVTEQKESIKTYPKRNKNMPMNRLP